MNNHYFEGKVTHLQEQLKTLQSLLEDRVLLSEFTAKVGLAQQQVPQSGLQPAGPPGGDEAAPHSTDGRDVSGLVECPDRTSVPGPIAEARIARAGLDTRTRSTVRRLREQERDRQLTKATVYADRRQKLRARSPDGSDWSGSSKRCRSRSPVGEPILGVAEVEMAEASTEPLALCDASQPAPDIKVHVSTGLLQEGPPACATALCLCACYPISCG